MRVQNVSTNCGPVAFTALAKMCDFLLLSSSGNWRWFWETWLPLGHACAKPRSKKHPPTTISEAGCTCDGAVCRPACVANICEIHWNSKPASPARFTHVHSGSCYDVGRIQSLQDSFEMHPESHSTVYGHRQPWFISRHRQPTTGNRNGFFEVAFGLFTLSLRFLYGWFRDPFIGLA